MRFRHRCQLRWGDFDAYRHLNNVRYLELFQEARIAFAIERFGGRGVLDVATVVARQEVDYLRPLEQRSGDVDVSVWVTRLGRSSVDLATEVLEPAADGLEPAGGLEPSVGEPAAAEGGPPTPVVYARGITVVVGWDLEGRRSRSFDDAERAAFTAYLEPSAGPALTG